MHHDEAVVAFCIKHFFCNQYWCEPEVLGSVFGTALAVSVEFLKSLSLPVLLPYLFAFLLGIGFGDLIKSRLQISRRNTDIYSKASSPSSYNEANAFGWK